MAVTYSIDQANVVDKIIIQFSDDQVYQLERIKSKFQILERAFVMRHQFPISVTYSITIHNSQGLTLKWLTLLPLYFHVVILMLHYQGLPAWQDSI